MAQTTSRVLALFAVAALAACPGGGGSDAGSGPAITTFTATPNSLPTAGGPVTLAWAVTGAASLSIDHGVGAVTPLTSGSTSVQVTATTTFTLTATDSSGTSTQTAVVTVAAPITVSGTVTDEYGSPAPGQTVSITSGAFQGSAVSDANGAFSVAGVPTPYTATVLDSGGKYAVQYQGLTRADPSLFDPIVVSPPYSATVAGQLDGAAIPVPTGDRATVEFVSPQTGLANSSIAVPVSGNFSGTVIWAGPTTTTGTLYALELHAVGGLPVDYPGYGTRSGVLLENMGTLSGQDVALSSVTTGTVSGTVTTPAGYAVTGKAMFFQPAANAVFGIVEDSSTSTSFSYTTPSISDATFTLVVTAQGTSGGSALVKKAGLAANESGVALTIPPAPMLSLPVNAATGVTVTTPFSWTSFTGVYLVIFSTGAGPSYAVFSAATTVTIPDLSSEGFPLPASAPFTWEVYGFGPTTSVDSLAVPGGFINLLYLLDGYTAVSQGRTFTTAP
jgi:Carboxypeptidase regulatory-like domain